MHVQYNIIPCSDLKGEVQSVDADADADADTRRIPLVLGVWLKTIAGLPIERLPVKRKSIRWRLPELKIINTDMMISFE